MPGRSRRNDPPPTTAQLLEAFKKICREAGLRVTHQRFEIFRALDQSMDHPSTEDVYHTVKRRLPTIALDTVYRTLTMLEQNGVLARVRLDTKARFDSNLKTHHHFICTECNSIDDFYWPSFDRMDLPAEKAPWGRIDAARVEVRGICQACLRRKKNPR